MQIRIIKLQVRNWKQKTRYRSNEITGYEFIKSMYNHFKNNV